jgi:hypothetical protein
MDATRADGYWRRLAQDYPDASSIGGAMKATFDRAQETGTLDDWAKWACDLATFHPDAGRLSYNVAIFASRSRLRGPCLAEAARNAKRLGVGPAWMDSLAVVLEGP